MLLPVSKKNSYDIYFLCPKHLDPDYENLVLTLRTVASQPLTIRASISKKKYQKQIL